MAALNLDRPAPSWSAEWSMFNEEGQDLELVAGLLFEDYRNLLALEEALSARREDLDFLASAPGP